MKRETVEDREIFVYLPPSYGEGDGRYPVVYLQDGGYLAEDSLNLLEHQFVIGELPELIFVGIPTENRNAEYTPWPAKALVSRFADFPGEGDRYLAFLVERLKPHIDASYRTLSGPPHTGIAGASLGALISLYGWYRYPEVFGRIISLSASFWYEGFVDFVKEQPLPSEAAKVYMYVGDLEGVYKDNIQQHMVPATHEIYQTLLDKGLGPEQLAFHLGEEATHDTVFFLQQFPEALAWLFQGQDEAASVQMEELA
nr:alpha/beta hydrolase-fold protein [Paenibacillus phyllosphaerae]